jgi:hypothetical protein
VSAEARAATEDWEIDVVNGEVIDVVNGSAMNSGE